MKSRDLQHRLVNFTGRTFADIDLRTRSLRAAGEITFGPRGTKAPDMSPVEIAMHLLALVARRASDAGEVTQQLVKRTCSIAHPDHADFLPSGKSVATMLGYALDEYAAAGASAIQGFEILDDGKRAWMHIKRQDGRIAKILFIDPDDQLAAAAGKSSADYNLIDSFTLGHRLVIGVEMLHFLGKAARVEGASSDVPASAA